MIFQEEHLAQVTGHIEALTHAHWQEAEARLHGTGYQYNAGHYATLEGLGMLALYTARHGGRLAGYAAFCLTPCPHRPGLTVAVLDGLYLCPQARQGLTALALLRHAEAGLQARGVGFVQYSSPAARPCDALYRRLGAVPTEQVWHKRLDMAEEQGAC